MLNEPVVSLAMTVRLPWAAAIRAGHKLIENRAKPFPERYIGERVGIHVAVAWSTEGAADPRIANWWWGTSRPPQHPVDPSDFPGMARHVVAVARVAGCHQVRMESSWHDAHCCEPWGDRHYVDPAKLAWHIELADVVPLAEPVGPVVGSLTVPWRMPPDVAGLVSERYLAAP